MSQDYLERQMRLLKVSEHLASTPRRAEACRQLMRLYERSYRAALGRTGDAGDQ